MSNYVRFPWLSFLDDRWGFRVPVLCEFCRDVGNEAYISLVPLHFQGLPISDVPLASVQHLAGRHSVAKATAKRSVEGESEKRARGESARIGGV